MSTPIKTLYLYLKNSGLFSDWTDSSGNIQPSPFVQTRRFDESAVDNGEPIHDQRIFLIKSLGGGGDRFTSDPVFTFSIFGFVGDNEAILEDYANLVYSALLDFEHVDCIVGVNPVATVGGAYPLASGRYWYDQEWKVTVSV